MGVLSCLGGCYSIIERSHVILREYLLLIIVGRDETERFTYNKTSLDCNMPHAQIKENLKNVNKMQISYFTI